MNKYYSHIENTKNQSLIARIYGIFKIKTNYFDDLYVMIMQNTSVLHSSESSILKFDLKGSSVNRATHVEEEYFDIFKDNKTYFNYH